MGADFAGEVARYYARFWRGYPVATVDAVVAAFGLGPADLVLDLGCGTGQLTLPLAGRVAAVIGMDPEPDMLAEARAAGLAAGTAGTAGTTAGTAGLTTGTTAGTAGLAAGTAGTTAGTAGTAAGAPNVTWVLGADTDVPALAGLLGPRRLGAVTIGTAVHWMRYEELFAALPGLLRPGGGVAVIANGVPLWQQDSDWSVTLRGVLERWFGRPLVARCGTDAAARAGYRSALRAAGFDDLPESVVEYSAPLDLQQLVGGLYSAMSASQLPADRAGFAAEIGRALAPRTRFVEQVRVATLLGRR
jgi:SAM-dependent methyltransferase